MQLKTNHLWNQHGNRLAQHGCFRLNTTDSPTEHTKSVDHGGMRIGTYQRIRVGLHYTVLFSFINHPGKMFKIYLVHNTGIRRNHLKIREGLLTPLQKTVAFLVTLVFKFAVEVHGTFRTKAVNLYRMVDNQFG